MKSRWRYPRIYYSLRRPKKANDRTVSRMYTWETNQPRFPMELLTDTFSRLQQRPLNVEPCALSIDRLSESLSPSYVLLFGETSQPRAAVPFLYVFYHANIDSWIKPTWQPSIFTLYVWYANYLYSMYQNSGSWAASYVDCEILKRKVLGHFSFRCTVYEIL